jgi:hypothetical protein
MDHDELCNSKVDPPLGMTCDGCELIAYVVLREREKAAKRANLTYVVNVSVTGPDDDAALEKIKHILASRMVVNVVGTRSDFV